jgi:hypothetical protein
VAQESVQVRSGFGLNKKKSRRRAHNQARGKYTRQRIRTTKNKELARNKHLASHPNDLQARMNILLARG